MLKSIERFLICIMLIGLLLPFTGSGGITPAQASGLPQDETPRGAIPAATWTGINGLIGLPGGSVRALAIDAGNNQLFVGGDFDQIDGMNVSHVAKLYPGVPGIWEPLGTGMNGDVYALAVDSSGYLYAGGDFTVAGGVSANHIARWDGVSWSALGAGVNQPVYALAWDGTGLYAGGEFTSAGGVAVNRVARWNGSAWSALIDSSNHTGTWGDVYALAWTGSDLYVGGSFILITDNGGSVGTALPADDIAKWTPATSTWSALIDGGASTYIGVDGEIFTLAWDSSNSNLYVGGSFDNITNYTYPNSATATTLANNIAMWIPGTTTWAALIDGGSNNGVDDTVRALLLTGSKLSVGGAFNNAGGTPAKHVAQWASDTWTPITDTTDEGVDDPVYAIQYFPGTTSNLYLGGNFSHCGSTATGPDCPQIAVFTDNGGGVVSWSAPTEGPHIIEVNAVVADNNGNVYVGGYFSEVDGVANTANLARWNGSAWQSLGGGIDGAVYTLLLGPDGKLYTGGVFTNVDGSMLANNIARWDPASNTWEVFGSGINAGVGGGVLALAFYGGNLTIGGYFTSAGGYQYRLHCILVQRRLACPG